MNSKGDMPEMTTDGTIRGTKVLVDGVDIAPWMTKIDVNQQGSIGIITVSFPSRITVKERNHLLELGGRVQLQIDQ